jgi:hypothetical protein
MKDVPAESILIKLLDKSIVKGKVSVGDFRRLSDRLNKGEDPFLIVFDATVEGHTGKVLMINKNQIMWAMPIVD